MKKIIISILVIAVAVVGVVAIYSINQNKELHNVINDTEIQSEKNNTQLKTTQATTMSSFKDINVDDVISFGKYEQDNNFSNGKENLEWIVLDIEDSKALLMTYYCFECKPYHEINEEITWENCTLRNWLNNDFFESAFSTTEKSQIVEITHSNSDYITSEVDGGNDTTDRIFIPGLELIDYFTDSKEALVAYGTEYAVSKLPYNDLEAPDQWWLRQPSPYRELAKFAYDGLISSTAVNSDSKLVRAMMWIEL